jgi:hypothetical protein
MATSALEKHPGNWISLFFGLGLSILLGCANHSRASDPADDDDTGQGTDSSTDTSSDTASGTDTVTDTSQVIPKTCEDAAFGRTSVGCLFYPVDLYLGYYPDTELSQYGVAVSNVQTDVTATVIMERKDGASWSPVFSPQVIAPMEQVIFTPPGDLHIESTGLRAGGAYRITSDVPITAYQINPLVSAFLSDATMLLPVSAWDRVYYSLGWKFYNYVTIVAAVDGTSVEFTTTWPIYEDIPSGIPALLPGESHTALLDEGDVVQFAKTGVDGNMAGSLITSDSAHPISVLSGNRCCNVPSDSGACDHMESQLFGVQRWGQEFVAARMPVRSTAEPIEDTYWQIVASEDLTTIEFTASVGVTGLPSEPLVLNAGEVFEAPVGGTMDDPGDFLISADRPIGVAAFMTGFSAATEPLELYRGDPAMVQISPVEQYLDRYVVMVPPTWPYDVAMIIRVAGTEVRWEDVPIDDSEFTPVGPTHEVARILIEDGVQRFDGDDRFAITVIGIGDADSYAYLGGIGTEVINIIPE